MPSSPNSDIPEKSNLHPRNKHRSRYDFKKLMRTSPELTAFVGLNEFKDLSVDFTDPAAVKALNKALLMDFYEIKYWDIPEGYLCPPVPGRADYIHYAADLLAADNEGIVPKGKAVKVFDVGVGANCIYPLIGHKEYGWYFMASEVDPKAVRSAKNIVNANDLAVFINVRKQDEADHILEGMINKGETYDLVMCNPPFHSSLKEAETKTARKWKNLGKKAGTNLNFGGKQAELAFEGGEQGFVQRMIRESASFATSCLWFTSLISKKETLPSCEYFLEKAGAKEVQIITMSQGQKTSRVLAWSFMDAEARQKWARKRWKKKF